MSEVGPLCRTSLWWEVKVRVSDPWITQINDCTSFFEFEVRTGFLIPYWTFVRHSLWSGRPPPEEPVPTPLQVTVVSPSVSSLPISLIGYSLPSVYKLVLNFRSTWGISYTLDLFQGLPHGVLNFKVLISKEKEPPYTSTDNFTLRETHLTVSTSNTKEEKIGQSYLSN